MTIYYAWRKFSGRRADGTIIAGIIPQLDGIRCPIHPAGHGGGNCGAASEAERIVSQQKGVRPGKGTPWQPTGASIRRETGDHSGGLMPSQTTAAFTSSRT